MLSNTRGFRIWLGVVIGVVVAGCDRNIEPFEPGEEPSPPDLARIFPAPAGGSADAAQGAGGETPRQAVPPSRAEGRGEAQPPANTGFAAGTAAGNGTRGNLGPSAVDGTRGNVGSSAIEGTIEMAPERVAEAPEGGILFVIARPQGSRGGPPLAVLRIPDPSFPLEFSIGPDNVMIPNMQFAGPIALSARLDADGNAMTRGESDVSSTVESSLAPGAQGVRLVLSVKGSS